MASALRLAFLRMGPHPIPNRLLPEALAAHPAAPLVEVFDVEAAVRRDWIAMAVNPAFVVLEHGVSLVRGRIRPWQAFFTTTWMWRRMSRLASEFVREGRFDRSLQIQSLFDGRCEGVPHGVYTDHTHLANLDYPDFDRRSLRGARWLSLERELYHRAAMVFSRSHNIERSLVERYGVAPERVRCIFAGSNAAQPAGTPPARPASPVEILFVGVDWERKGGPQLVEAFRRVRSRHAGLRLRIVGCNPPLDEAGVEVVGKRPLAEIHRDYERASIFAMPTRREPFGVAFVEALHHGLPIVATRVGALPDLVREGENGYLVEVDDVDALTARLEALVAQPELRARFGARGLALARALYTWEAVSEHMMEALDAQRPALRAIRGSAA